jgi:hypothetical protein
MKTTIIALLALVTSAVAQDVATKREHSFVFNPHLPYNAVEIGEFPQLGDFYSIIPETKPINVPSTYVLVEVYFNEPLVESKFDYAAAEDLRFAGWAYLEAEMVNYLHQRESTRQL